MPYSTLSFSFCIYLHFYFNITIAVVIDRLKDKVNICVATQLNLYNELIMGNTIQDFNIIFEY